MQTTEVVSDDRGAQAIHRALTILEAFSSLGPALTLTEISEYARLTVPTTHRMVKAFVSRRYLVHNPATGRYGLGPTIMRLAQVLSHRADKDQLISLANPYMEELRELSGETVGLHVRIDTQRLCVSELVSRSSVRMESGVGHVFPLSKGAASKVILTFLPEGERNGILRQLTQEGPQQSLGTDEETLRKTLAGVAARGYAMSVGESVKGASGLAAPLFGSRGVVAAINIAGPAERWTPDLMARFVPELLRMASEISDHLGYVNPHEVLGEGPSAALDPDAPSATGQAER